MVLKKLVLRPGVMLSVGAQNVQGPGFHPQPTKQCVYIFLGVTGCLLFHILLE